MAIKTFALLYPLRQPLNAETMQVFIGAGRPPTQASATKLLNTTVFTQGCSVVRVFQLDGELADAVEHLTQLTVVHNVGKQLAGILALGHSIETPDGLRHFFETQLMKCIV